MRTTGNDCRAEKLLRCARIFPILLIALFFPAVSSAQQEPAGDMQSQMQSGIESLKKEMADLEKQIAAAKQQNNTEEAQQLQQQLDMLKKNLSAMQGGTKKMQNAAPKDWEAAAAAEPDRKIPRKDAARIATVPRNILSDAELQPFLVKTHNFVDRRIQAKNRSLAEQLFHTVKAKSPAAGAVAASANGLWATGQPEIALWMMGKAAMADPNPDNLNNYAAFLVMAGAEESALPLLMKLNQQFPDNSTILNNIGQAWFGLGDLDQSKKYLDQAVRFFAVHSQANYTEALIAEAKGDKPAAIAAVKHSLEQAYSQEREGELQHLGNSLSSAELQALFHMPQDPLGLHKFMLPRFPQKMGEVEQLEKEWDSFHAAVSAEAKVTEAKIKALQPKAELAEQQNLQALQAASQGVGRGRGRLTLPYPPYGRKAQRIIAEATQDFARFQKQYAERQASNGKDLDNLIADMSGQIGEITQRYADMPETEGMDDAECAEQKPIVDKFLRAANAILESQNSDRLTANRRYLNETTYGLQYLQDDASFQVTKLEARKQFLDELLGTTAAPWCADCGVVICHQKEEAKGPGRRKLPDFDDIHCDHHIKLDMILVQGEFTCNKANLEYDAIFFSGKQVEDLNTGKILSGSVEIMLSTGIGKALPLGPLKAEVRAGVGVFIEYDDGGITDMGPQFVVKGEVGFNVPEGMDPTEFEVGHGKSVGVGELPSVVEVGVEGRWGWNASATLEGKGLLGHK